MACPLRAALLLLLLLSQPAIAGWSRVGAIAHQAASHTLSLDLLGKPPPWPACDLSWRQQERPGAGLNDDERWRVQRYLGEFGDVPVDADPAEGTTPNHTALDALRASRAPALGAHCEGGSLLLHTGADVDHCSRASEYAVEMRCFLAAYMAAAFPDRGVRRAAKGALLWPWRYGDSTRTLRPPYLTKSRLIGAGRGGAVLLPLHHMRFAPGLYTVHMLERKHPLPFLERQPCAFWRGATTGNVSRVILGSKRDGGGGRGAGRGRGAAARPAAAAHGSTRLSLVERWAGVKDRAATGGVQLDVAFSTLSSGLKQKARSRGVERAELGQLARGRVDIGTMLRCRYQLAPEGNDVATALAWQLFTDSVVLMPPPTKENWLLQSELRAWEHYVPVRPDWSDLGERLAWCEAHPRAGANISARARAHVLRAVGATVESERRVVVAVLHAFRRVVSALPPAVAKEIATLAELAIAPSRGSGRLSGKAARRRGGSTPQPASTD